MMLQEVTGGGETTENKKAKIVKIIASVIDKVDQNQQVSLNSILVQLRDLLLVIEETRHEISTLSPQELKGKHIATATDQLDAIIEATSEATGSIMDSCEVIQDKLGALEGEEVDVVNVDVINEEVMKIYEACSFQDITGQRISRVVATFRTIEEKIDHLVSVLGIKIKEYVPEEDGREGDERLLNGPQLPADAISQDDIDKLLAEFDAED
ncbi:MAG: protein phosphatase CheZ [Alphaproteobacteria bacterium]